MRKIELYTTGNCQERGFELTFIQDNILIDIFVFDKIPGTNQFILILVYGIMIIFNTFQLY